mgnify:FL=1
MAIPEAAEVLGAAAVVLGGAWALIEWRTRAAEHLAQSRYRTREECDGRHLEAGERLARLEATTEAARGAAERTEAKLDRLLVEGCARGCP